jgi:hypothetical protein
MKTTNSESCKSVNNNTLRNKYCFYFKIVRVNSFVPNLYSDRYVTVDSGLFHQQKNTNFIIKLFNG